MKHTLTVDDQSYMIERHEEMIEETDLIALLEQQSLYPKFYWKGRGSEETIIAIGSCLQLDHVPGSILADPNIRFYGGLSFLENTILSTLWEEFLPTYFFLPCIEVIQTPSSTRLITYAISENPLMNYQNVSAEDINPEPYVCRRTDLPTNSQWVDLIGKALKKIENKGLQKVVLARMSTFETTDIISPYLFLKTLQNQSVHTTVFLFMPKQDSAFLGSTPEKLYTRQQRDLQTEALAGTTVRGATPFEDAEHQKKLLESSKDIREVQAVESFLTRKCEMISEKIEWEGQYRIIQTAKVQHLYKQLCCILKESINDKILLECLHPTPALAGLMQEMALSFIQEHEPFDRGWYGGCIGWISQHAADFAVSIRSALVCKNKIHLFAGTGIVEGSDPEKEWDELDHKISQFGALLHE